VLEKPIKETNVGSFSFKNYTKKKNEMTSTQKAKVIPIKVVLRKLLETDMSEAHRMPKVNNSFRERRQQIKLSHQRGSSMSIPLKD